MSHEDPASITARACDVYRPTFDQMLEADRIDISASFREHISGCERCWASLNHLKWWLARESSSIAELKDFLGERYIEAVDASRHLADDWLQRQPKELHEIDEYYRSNEWYVYNLTLWEASGRRPPYVRWANELLRSNSVRTVADFGAGVGNDSLPLAEAGFAVYSIEFDNLSSEFLRYRVKRRGLEDAITFVDVDKLAEFAEPFDALWAMDVLEHLIDPAETLEHLLGRSKVFIYDSDYAGTAGGMQPFHFDHDSQALEEAWRSQGFRPVRHSGGELRAFLRDAPSSEPGGTDHDFAAVIFDLDGTLWREGEAVPHAGDVIDALRSRGTRVGVLTNYSSRSRAALAADLSACGVAVRADEMYTASFLTAHHVASVRGSAHVATLGGGPALLNDLLEAGVPAVPLHELADGDDPVVLVIGFDANFGLAEVTAVLRVQHRVASVFAAERDRWFGSRDGPTPASAWVVAAVEETLGLHAVTVGKPNPLALRTVAAELGVRVSQILMVGDSARSDVMAAVNAGAMSCLYRDPVLGAREDIDRGPEPDYSVEDLLQILSIVEHGPN